VRVAQSIERCLRGVSGSSALASTLTFISRHPQRRSLGVQGSAPSCGTVGSSGLAIGDWLSVTSESSDRQTAGAQKVATRQTTLTMVCRLTSAERYWLRSSLRPSPSCGCDGTFVVCRRLHRELMLYCMTFQKVYFARIDRLSTIGFPATTNGGIIPRL
jgi:hypothetical protein